MRIHRQGSARAGFSLVEILCAILILGVGLAGLVQGLTTALASNKESELQTVATFIAAGRIDLLQADGFLIEGEDSGPCDDLPMYQWRQSITRTSVEGLYDVQVTVEHAKTGDAIFELRTLLFDPPLLPTSSETEERTRSTRAKKGGGQ
jgi:prepilin-type N-terminal cleavage/methylation domain-containing protein